MPPKVVSIKTTKEAHDAWKAEAAAEGMSFNAWAISALNDQVALSGALAREKEATVVERAKVLKKSRPQTSGSCKHEGYKHLPFCYRCGARTN